MENKKRISIITILVIITVIVIVFAILVSKTNIIDDLVNNIKKGNYNNSEDAIDIDEITVNVETRDVDIDDELNIQDKIILNEKTIIESADLSDIIEIEDGYLIVGNHKAIDTDDGHYYSGLIKKLNKDFSISRNIDVEIENSVFWEAVIELEDGYLIGGRNDRDGLILKLNKDLEVENIKTIENEKYYSSHLHQMIETELHYIVVISHFSYSGDADDGITSGSETKLIKFNKDLSIAENDDFIGFDLFSSIPNIFKVNDQYIMVGKSKDSGEDDTDSLVVKYDKDLNIKAINTLKEISYYGLNTIIKVESGYIGIGNYRSWASEVNGLSEVEPVVSGGTVPIIVKFDEDLNVDFISNTIDNKLDYISQVFKRDKGYIIFGDYLTKQVVLELDENFKVENVKELEEDNINIYNVIEKDDMYIVIGEERKHGFELRSYREDKYIIASFDK